MNNTVIITKHKALVEYLTEIGLANSDTTVIQRVTQSDIEGKDVIGVLPLRLACYANSITDVRVEVPKELRNDILTLSQFREFVTDISTYKINQLPELTKPLPDAYKFDISVVHG